MYEDVILVINAILRGMLLINKIFRMGFCSNEPNQSDNWLLQTWSNKEFVMQLKKRIQPSMRTCYCNFTRNPSFVCVAFLVFLVNKGALHLIWKATSHRWSLKIAFTFFFFLTLLEWKIILFSADLAFTTCSWFFSLALNNSLTECHI